MLNIIKQEFKIQFKNIALWLFFIQLFINIFFNDMRYLLDLVKYTYKVDFRKFYVTFGAGDSLARTFCDYTGAGIYFFLPIIAAFSFNSFKKHKCEEIIFCKQVNSVDFILGKYIGFCSYVFLFILLFTLIPVYYGFKLQNEGVNINPFIIFRYVIIWLLPTIMICIALSMFLAVLCDNYIAPIVFHFIIFLPNILQINVKYHLLKLVIRMNEDDPVLYEKVKNNILANRIFITFLSIVFIFATSYIYNLRRKNNAEKITIFKKIRL